MTKESCRIYHMNNKETVHKRQRTYYERNKEKIKARHRAMLIALKTEVFSHYGGKCACCGETELEFLTMDHKHENGAEHRRESGIDTGATMYRFVRECGYPNEYQVLCFNCNLSSHMGGGVCAHKRCQKKVG